jgi:hypothetical protein
MIVALESYRLFVLDLNSWVTTQDGEKVMIVSMFDRVPFLVHARNINLAQTTHRTFRTRRL